MDQVELSFSLMEETLISRVVPGQGRGGWVKIAFALEELRLSEVRGLLWDAVRQWAQQFQFAIGLLQ